MAPKRQVSPERKALYYVGMVVTAIGLLTGISVFISAASHFGDFSNFQERGRSMIARTLIGFLMIVGGGFLSRIGRMGMAGSGIKLDPEEARKDVEPWARMTDGVVKDAMDEAGIKTGSQATGERLPFDERLRRLQKLREDGLVSDLEFEATKKKILENA